jgi:hypothetical protein
MIKNKDNVRNDAFVWGDATVLSLRFAAGRLKVIVNNYRDDKYEVIFHNVTTMTICEESFFSLGNAKYNNIDNGTMLELYMTNIIEPVMSVQYLQSEYVLIE